MKQYSFENTMSCLPVGENIPPANYAIDELRFSRIVDMFSAKLFNLSYRITKNRSVSEDIVQESFLKLWMKRSDLVLIDTGSWLGKVVMNMSYNHLKRESIKAKTIAAIQYSTKEVWQPDGEERMIRKEKEAAFQKVFTELPPQQKIVYCLSKKKDLSRIEIAQYLNISPHTVKYHLNKAVQFLKENIGIASMVLLFFLLQILFSNNTSTNTGLDCLINNGSGIVKKEKIVNRIVLSCRNRL